MTDDEPTRDIGPADRNELTTRLDRPSPPLPGAPEPPAASVDDRPSRDAPWWQEPGQSVDQTTPRPVPYPAAVRQPQRDQPPPPVAPATSPQNQASPPYQSSPTYQTSPPYQSSPTYQSSPNYYPSSPPYQTQSSPPDPSPFQASPTYQAQPSPQDPWFQPQQPASPVPAHQNWYSGDPFGHGPALGPVLATTPVPPRNRRTLRIAAIAAIGVAAVGALIAVAVVLTTPSERELDVVQVQKGVTQVLTDSVNGYGAKDVSDVRCNEGKNPAATKGSSFACTGTVNGDPRRIEVVVVDDNATYAIDWPRKA